MAPVPFYQVDAFTDNPFRGNPAAICLMSTRLEDSLYLELGERVKIIGGCVTVVRGFLDLSS